MSEEQRIERLLCELIEVQKGQERALWSIARSFSELVKLDTPTYEAPTSVHVSHRTD